MFSFIKTVVNTVTSSQSIQIGERSLLLKDLLGEGGFAFVYVAEDEHSGERFAVKKILAQDAEGRRIAEKEIEMLKLLRGHPNILKFLGSCRREVERPQRSLEYYLLLEFCPGGCLMDLIKKCDGRPMKEAKLANIFTQICRAVQHLHSRKPPICHRDLKIENVLISGDGTMKLCDFGSCVSREQIYSTTKEITTEEEIISKYSTQMYRSPEMVDLYKRVLVSTKSDIWALGCILYTIAFFTHPFQDGGNLQIISGTYNMPESHSYSKYLTALMKKMLTVDVDKRPDIDKVLEMCDQWASWLQTGKSSQPRPSSSSTQAPSASQSHSLPSHDSKSSASSTPTASAVKEKSEKRKSKKKAVGDDDGWADFGSATITTPVASAQPINNSKPSSLPSSNAPAQPAVANLFDFSSLNLGPSPPSSTNQAPANQDDDWASFDTAVPTPSPSPPAASGVSAFDFNWSFDSAPSPPAAPSPATMDSHRRHHTHKIEQVNPDVFQHMHFNHPKK